jgi:uncharacterized protein (UPF0276 family)
VIGENGRAPPCNPMPASAGIGLRAQHHLHVMSQSPLAAWFEAHSENYFADGGAHVECLARIRANYPLSLHGVGLSLGSTDELDPIHLTNLRRAVARFEPALISEHLSWSSAAGRFANDLLPLPYTEEALRHVSSRIRHVQDALGRQILLENVSSYLQYATSTLTEWEFVAAVAAYNHGFAWQDYLQGIPPDVVQEFHLAGHSRVQIEGRELLIDTHGSPVSEAVWDVYRAALQRFGNVPTLIEWDTDIPEFEVLAGEARTADSIRTTVHAIAA